MASFKLNNDAGLKEFNEFLATRSYVAGYTASGADLSVLSGAPASVDASKYPHVSRWLTHINSFTPYVRASWSGAAEEKKSAPAAASKSPAAKPTPAAKSPVKAAAAPAKKPADDDDDDDDDDGGFNLDESSDDEAQARIDAIAAKKIAADAAAGKKKAVAKSTLILDVKPCDDETDLTALEAKIRAITQDGLLWGACEKIPVAYGIKKLRILSVLEDEKVSVDALQEEIESWEDQVQSTDVHAFNKL
jgi:elongation factor 1-beta